MNLLLRTHLVLVLLFLPIHVILGQSENSAPLSGEETELDSLGQVIQDLEDEIQRKYFENAEAKNYAIACARFAEESYFYAKDIHQGYNLNRSYAQRARANADTSYWFLKKSKIMADSAIYHANDSDKVALDYMYLAKEHLELAEKNLFAVYQATEPVQLRYAGTRTMFETSNALVDAYHASLYFGGVGRQEPQHVTRLEADEAAFNALLYLYEERIAGLEADIEKLKGQLKQAGTADELAELQQRIDELEEEKALLESKLGNARGQLEEIETELDIQEQASLAENGDPDGEGGNDGSGNGSDVPLDQEIPDGLVYRIQVGYYPRSNTPKFHGVTSIDGVKDGSYIRYYTGIYGTYQEATQAKNNIREYIIEDAFLVAFYDQKKISVYDALQLEKKLQEEQP